MEKKGKIQCVRKNTGSVQVLSSNIAIQLNDLKSEMETLEVKITFLSNKDPISSAEMGRLERYIDKHEILDENIKLQIIRFEKNNN